MTSPTRFHAVIIGAGPAGSAAAILLAHAGWAVALVERQRFPRRKVCGECVAASNLPLFDLLGIGEAFAANAGPALRRVTLLRKRHQVSADLPAADNGRHPWGRALGREQLDSMLLLQARAAGAYVLQPWSVVALHKDAGIWHCQLRAAESGLALTLYAPVLIDAHGAWQSLALDQPLVHPRPAAGDLFAFKANFTNAALRTDAIGVLALDGGYGGMVVADSGVATVACCIRRDRLQGVRRASPAKRAGDAIETWLARQCNGVALALQAATRQGQWLAAGPIRPGIRIRADDKFFRIGNAAGEAHPILGEGISMALQSAALLCTHLLGDQAVARMPGDVPHYELQRRYEFDWHRRFNSRLRLAAAFAHVSMHPQPAASMISIAHRFPGLLTLGARLGGKVCTAKMPEHFETREVAAAAQRAPAALAPLASCLPLETTET